MRCWEDGVAWIVTGRFHAKLRPGSIFRDLAVVSARTERWLVEGIRPMALGMAASRRKSKKTSVVRTPSKLLALVNTAVDRFNRALHEDVDFYLWEVTAISSTKARHRVTLRDERFERVVEVRGGVPVLEGRRANPNFIDELSGQLMKALVEDPDGGKRLPPTKEEARAAREFEANRNRYWPSEQLPEGAPSAAEFRKALKAEDPYRCQTLLERALEAGQLEAAVALVYSKELPPPFYAEAFRPIVQQPALRLTASQWLEIANGTSSNVVREVALERSTKG